nr:hypothetical protein [Tanacetum cinerariifolium]
MKQHPLWFINLERKKKLKKRIIVVVAAGVGDGVAAVVVFRWRSERRVRESGVEGRIDRVTRKLFGFAGKIPPEKFSGGRRVVAGGG